MEHAQGRAVAPALTYEQALAYITGLGRFGVKLGLERTRAILGEAGRPLAGLRGALVAGTNGKGSTAAFLAAILAARGLRVGTTPSPHLSSYTERIQVGGVPIPERDFADAVARLRPALSRVIEAMGEPTEFELLAALAIDHLAPRVDRLVVEIGMGGRLDSFNVLDLGVAVITNVGLDHTRWLGGTVELIAAEKAGIIKAGDAVVTGATGRALEVVERAAATAGVASLWRLGRELRLEVRDRGWEGFELDVSGPGFEHLGLESPLLGAFQAENAALAVAAAHAMREATSAAVKEGVAGARWPGRLEPWGERLLLDGGHNPDGLRRLCEAVRRLLDERPLAVVFGVMADKDAAAMLAELRKLVPGHVVFTAAAAAGSRAMAPEHLRQGWGGGEVRLPAEAALGRARELVGPAGWVLVCGSLYLVGELRLDRFR